MAHGGRGCIHPDSLIETPDGPIRIADFEGGEVLAFNGTEVVAAYAGKTVFYPAAQLYLVVFDDGAEIKTTAKHRFLTSRGWVACSSLLCGDSIAAPLSELRDGQPPKYCAASLSGLTAGVLHCLRILAGFQWHYFADYHQCDERLLMGSKTVLDVSRQLIDAPPHNHRAVMREDARAFWRKNSRSRLSHHLSTLGGLLEEVAHSFAAQGNCADDIVSGLLSASSQALQLSHEKSSPEQQGRRLAKLFVDLDSLTCRDESLQRVFGILRLGVDDSSYSAQVVCSHDLTITKRIVSVEACETAVYCDIFVPFFNNYISAGVVHHNSAKSWGFARALLIQAAAKPLRILCAREVQRSIKDSVHRLLTDQAQALGLGGFYADTVESEIRGKNGSLFLFAGLAQHTVESIKSFEGVDIVWCEEAQVITKRSWDVLVPTIRKDDSEIWITLNPDMETDETYQRFVDNPPSNAVVVQMNWRDNPWFPKTLEAERQETMRRDPGSYDNIWEGKPKRVADGAIYMHEIDQLYLDGRCRHVPYDPMLRVHTVWDLGFADSMAIGLFQRTSSEVRCIGYIEDSRRTLDYYVAELEKLPYRWGTDFIPHDGRARDFKTGRSTEEILTSMGRTVEVLPAASIEEGIKAARILFPRVYIDKERCGMLLEHLKRYQRVINRATSEGGAPLHDEHSHGADMFRYAAMAVEMMGNAVAAKPIEYKRKYLS